MGYEENLIKLVRAHSILYDKNDKGYKDLAAKEKIWTNIARTLKKDVYACKARWKSLRDSFYRKAKFIREHPTEFRKEYKYHNHLNFLLTLNNIQKIDDKAKLYIEEITNESTTPSRNIVECESRDIKPFSSHVRSDIRSLLSDDNDLHEINSEDDDDPLVHSDTFEDDLRTTGKPTQQIGVEVLEDSSREKLPVFHSLQSPKRRKLSPNDNNTQPQQQQQRYDGIDHFFLGVASVVRQHNLSVADLLKFQVGLLNYVNLKLNHYVHKPCSNN